jgi:hypothetical protein
VIRPPGPGRLDLCRLDLCRLDLCRTAHQVTRSTGADADWETGNPGYPGTRLSERPVTVTETVVADRELVTPGADSSSDPARLMNARAAADPEPAEPSRPAAARVPSCAAARATLRA